MMINLKLKKNMENFFKHIDNDDYSVQNCRTIMSNNHHQESSSSYRCCSACLIGLLAGERLIISSVDNNNPEDIKKQCSNSELFELSSFTFLPYIIKSSYIDCCTHAINESMNIVKFDLNFYHNLDKLEYSVQDGK